MLGNKRKINRKVEIRHKSLSEKLNQVSNKKEKRKDKDEESIKSDDDIIGNSSDTEEENKNKINEEKKEKNKFETNKIESYDEKKVRLAKELINKLERKKEKDNDDLSEDEEDNELNKEILLKYAAEEKKRKKNYFEIPNFNPNEILFLKGHKSTITDLDISKDSNLIITSSKDCRGIIFDINKNKKTLIPKFTNKALYCCSLSPDNKTIYFGGKDRNIYQIDLKTNNIIQKIKAHNECVTGIRFDTSKDQFYSVGNDHVLKVWSSDTSQSVLLETFYGHTSKINYIETIPGEVNKILTSSMDNYVNLWKVDSQSFLQFKINDIYPVDCLTGINQNIFFTGDFNGNISCWKTNKKKPIKHINFSHGYFENFHISHPFFFRFDKENLKGPLLKVGNPILSIGSILYSDLVFSGSLNGDVNFYSFNEDDNYSSFDKKINLQLKNKGCINVLKSNYNGDFIVAGNGKDNRMGRWFSDYNTKLGITIIKLFKN